jgi:hypothetical protein|tara:strand:- start:300 stop:554 length:255 start_codon:yes stop_codon:yes gene_type:complete
MTIQTMYHPIHSALPKEDKEELPPFIEFDDDNDDMNYVLVLGYIWDGGIHLIGPFETYVEACEYMKKKNLEDEADIVEVDKPED